jgi:Ser/Thr protein kinase RdoA (MazF antagonist)
MVNEAVEKAIGEWLFRYYGLEGRLERLGGENLNYLLVTLQGEKFVFKAVDDDSAEESAAMEFELLEHARKAGFPLELPYIIKNYKGNIYSRINFPINGDYQARVISFVDGNMLEKYSDISSNLLRNTGKCLAMFDRAIAGFDHPAVHRGHQWELTRAGRHRDKLDLISDPGTRQLADWAFDIWEAVKDTLPDLPQQVIHGDANKENILADSERVTGLVDFGDVCYNARVCELAICLAYMMMDRDDPMAAAAHVIAGYVEEGELFEDELAVLLPLVCGRLAVTVCMASSRLAVDPDNPNWFVSLEPAARLLRTLFGIGVDRL